MADALPTYPDLIRELMVNWSALNERVRLAFPDASDEERYQIARAVMNRSLGIEVAR